MSSKGRSYTLVVLLMLWGIFSFGQKDWEKKLQTQLIQAADGATIELDAGNFVLSKSLSLESKKNITIRGKGMNETILSFKGQTQGAEGLKISNAENITLENFTIQDSKGDAIKTMHVTGITFRKVKTEWTGKPKKENGSYGLYPVSCTKVLIDSCVAIGASDAGIYVGQSSQIVVKNCLAYHNVAGIEIENSLYAEVFHNDATLALRTQQVIAHESGVTNVVDPLGGSYFIERLTLDMEEGAYKYFDAIDRMGGMVAAIEAGFPQREIAESSYRFQQAFEKKEKIMVGVNAYVDANEPPFPILYIDDQASEQQLARLVDLRKTRDNAAVARTLDALKDAARTGVNTMYPLLECVRAYATVGEMCDALREVWGEYEEVPSI